MRKIVVALAGTISGLVLLLSYDTSTAGIAAPSTSGTNDDPTRTTPSPTAGSASEGSFTGDAASTRWGPVQVQVTMASGRISRVTVLKHPKGNPRDEEINSYALPILDQETLDAQSAQIDHVSGATDTSDGYVASLQSALDRAHA